MTAQRVTIRQINQHMAEVMVNGVDMAGIVSAYHVHADHEDGPQVVLQFSAAVLPEFDGHAELQVTEDLHEALVHLGWRPPPAPEVEECEISTLGGPERVFLRTDGTYRTEPWHVPEPAYPIDVATGETMPRGQSATWVSE